MPANAIRAAERLCRWQNHRPGAQLLRFGEQTSHVLFVWQGRVRVLNYSSAGRVVGFASVGPGGMVGELAAIDGLPRSASVVVLAPTVAARLSGEDFRELMRISPEFTRALVRHLAKIVRASDAHIMDLAELNASQRVCLQLLRLAEPDAAVHRTWVVHPLPTQAMIASEAGTTRETVARVMSRLADQGIIERKGRSLFLRDRDQLELLTVREPSAA